MIGSILDACDFATMTNRELVRVGVPRERVTWERLRRTGHPRRVSPTWAPSIGRWGGVASLREIAFALDVPVAQAHSWARFRGLRTRTRKFHRTQALLAVAALATPGASRDVARKLGILPIECALYRAAAEVLRTELGVTLLEVLEWSPKRLEDAWRDLDLVVEHVPPRTTVDHSNSEEIAAIVDEAMRAMNRPTPFENALAVVRRELPDIRPSTGSLPPDLAADLADLVAVAEQDLADEVTP